METLRVERSSGEAQASPDPSWRGLYRAGGVSAVLFVVLTIVSIVLIFTTPQPSHARAGLPPSSTSPHIGQSTSLEQVLFVGPSVLAMVVFLALYVALKHLSKSYAAIGAVVGIAAVVLALA